MTKERQPNSIQIHRTRIGKSVEDCAGLVGVSAHTWYRWEWGHMVPRLNHLIAIARVLGIPVEVLSDLADKQGTAA